MRPICCPECRRLGENGSTPPTAAKLIEATGRMRMRGHKRLPRQPYREAEVIHTLCGHIWWSKNTDAIRQADRLSGGMME